MPIAAPSANRSGHVSPTTAAHVEADLGDRVAMILDGGATLLGLESTVVDVDRRPRLSSCASAALRARTSRARSGCRPSRWPDDENVAPSSPGMLARHYAPATGVRLDAREVRPGEALLAFGSDVPRHAGRP